MTDLAIIIVNWNVGPMLAGCLRAALADLTTSRLSGQVWVVDNASTDGSVAMLRRDFPEVQLIASRQNLGFAAGNNLALRAMGFVDRPDQVLNSSPENHPKRMGEVTSPVKNKPKVVLLLNPDTVVHPGALSALFNFLENNPGAGIAGAQLLYGDGSFQHSVFGFPGLWQLAIELLPLPGRLFESRLNGRYKRSLYELGRPFKVDHPLGAAMSIRQEAIEQVGLLDERFLMYAEEVDWCKRITSAGWEAYCVPAAKVTHFGGQSTGQIKTSSFLNLWTSRYQFYRKHYHPLTVWLAAQIVRQGMQYKTRQDCKAAGRGELTPTELQERLHAYEKIINVWQGEKKHA